MTTASGNQSEFGVEDALRIAEDAHKDQVDKAGEPYIGHVLRVMARVDTDAEKMAAALHDVVEDTDATPEWLRDQGVPDDVVEAVQALTKRDGEPYDAFVLRAGANPIARQVKIADLADNANPQRIAALRLRNEALATELRARGPEFESDADRLEAKPAQLEAKYAKALGDLGATEQVAEWWQAGR